MKKIRLRNFLLGCLVLSIQGTLIAQDPNFHIYLCFGQSNMLGAGTIEAQDRINDSRIQVMGALNCSQGGKTYSVGKWQNYSPPTVRCNSGLGPSDYFARTMAANLPSNVKIGLVPVAIEGSDIAIFEKNNYANYLSTAATWMVNVANQYGGNPYARLVEVAKKAQKDGVIKGILLHQGETNNGQQTWPSRVKGVYDNLIKDLGLDPAQTPLLVGELLYQNQGGVCYGHNTVIAKMPGVISNSHVISANGLPGVDQFHFTSAGNRTLGQRYAQKMLTLLPKGTPPNVSLTAPANNSSFTTLQTVALSATATDPDGSIAKVDFYDGSTLLGSDNSSPYTYSWSNPKVGTHTLTAVATDNVGLSKTSSAITISVIGMQAAYNNQVHQIPGVVQVEEYDQGGNGVAYNDATAGSATNVPFRSNEDVDLEVCTDVGGGYNLGWATAGEWVEYTIDVAAGGSYDLDLRVAAEGEGKTLLLSLDGVQIGDAINVPNTGGWQKWSTVSLKGIQLKAGQQVMRLTIGASDYVNVNYFEFKSSNLPTGLNEQQVENNRIYPNPFDAHGLTISRKGTYRYKVTDVSGLVVEQNTANGETTIGSQLQQGLYFLTIDGEVDIQIQKVLKQ